MANVGEIHLRGAPSWEPRAREVFADTLAKFKADPKRKSFLPQLPHVQDIAERAFLRTLARVAEKNQGVFVAEFERAAPGEAHLAILDALIAWNSTKKRRR